MNTKLTFLSLALAVCSCGMAQTLEFKHCNLKNMKFVTASNSAVNIRKSPNKNAPKLYSGCIPETDDCGYMWSDALDKSYDSSPYMLTNVDYMATTGVNSGFWKIQVGTTNYNFPAYVAQSVTKVVSPEPVTAADIENQSSVYYLFSGTLNNVVMMVNCNEVEGWSNILVGILENGVITFSHSTEGSIQYDSGVKGIEFGSNSDGLLVKFGDKFKKHISNEWNDIDILDVNKMLYSHQVQLLEKLGCNKTPNMLAVFAKSDQNIVSTLSMTPSQSDEFIYSTKNYVPKTGEGSVWDNPEVQPRFPGGQSALIDYLAANVKYPKDAQKAGVEGRVVVSFIVEKDGKINDVKVVKSVHKSLDKEATRVVKAMPKWTPGSLNNKPVQVKYNLPVTFKLNK